MRTLTNYHTHTTYCDGKEGPEAFIEAALERGFSALGFSAHAPAPRQESWTMAEKNIPGYLREIGSLREKYKDRIEIYCGMEVDYIAGVMGPSSSHILELGLDYTLGAVHIVPLVDTDEYLTVDGPEEEYGRILTEGFRGDNRSLAEFFFRQVRGLVKEHRFDILAHFDLIKVHNKGERFYKEEESWYREAVFETLDAIAESGVIMEINTGGLSRGKTSTFYPSPWILKETRKRNIPVVINSDVHSPEGIDALFDEAITAARDAGYTTKRVLLQGAWRDVPL